MTRKANRLIRALEKAVRDLVWNEADPRYPGEHEVLTSKYVRTREKMEEYIEELESMAERGA